ncbi:phage tail protein, partial [Azohydromonas lata]|nr:phage tail protein [Azohydromonas lata]
MDANGARFWQLADAAHWRAGEHVRWDAACGALTLASERRLDTPVDAAAQALATAALDEVPRAVDAAQGVARWSADISAVVVRSTLPGEVLLLSPAQTPTDLCVDGDGVFHAVLPDGVLMHDLRGRFEDAMVDAPAGFTPWRAAAVAGEGGLWLLERGSGRIARLSGRPMPVTTPPRAAYAPGVFRPQPENCRPPRMDLVEGPVLDAGEQALAIAACNGVLGVLAWNAGFQPRLHVRRDGAWAAPVALADARYAYTLAWFDGGRIAVRLPGRREAPAFEPGADGGPLLPLGTVYPLPAGTPEAPFAHRLDGPPQLPQADGGAEPLLPLSRRFLAPAGAARHWRMVGSGDSAQLDAQLLDSGQSATVWHRLFAEASIPEGCGFVVWLAATAGNAPPADDDGAWQPHAFGQDVAALAGDALTRETPRAAWERGPSELPNHPGLARWTPQRGRRGLFSVLIQAGTQRVRRLVGRFLWVRVQLWGNVRSAPEIAALRAYAGRFDYVDQYLPRLYRESLFGALAQSPGEELRRLGANLPALVAELDAGTLPAALAAGFGAAGLPPA